MLGYGGRNNSLTMNFPSRLILHFLFWLLYSLILSGILDVSMFSMFSVLFCVCFSSPKSLIFY